MTDLALNGAFEAAGEWFLPEAPEHSIAGTLKYSAAHTELTLNDSFRPIRGAYRVGDKETYPLIYGSTTKGELATIVGAQRFGFDFNLGSAGVRQPERVIATLLVIGEHLAPNFEYRQVQIRIPGLELWLSRPVVNQEWPVHDPAKKTPWINYQVFGLPEETVRIEGLATTVGWAINSHHSATHTTVSVEASGWVRIRPDQPKTVEWFLAQIQKITTFLGILAGCGMSPDCINASPDESRRSLSILVTLRDAEYCPYTHSFQFFVPRDAMGTELASAICRWFDVYSRIDTPSQLALSVLTSKNLWLHVEFLSLMQALEGYHRGLYSGSYVTADDYKPVEKTLVAAIPPHVADDFRSALRSKLKYGFEFSLRKRLNELTDKLSSGVRGTILATADGRVPGQWVDTRNYYTHWDEELRATVLAGEPMYHANVRLRMFLRVLYLSLIGVPEDALLRSIGNRSDIAQHLAQLNIVHRRRTIPGDQSGVVMRVLDGPNTDIPPPAGDEGVENP